MTVSPTLTALAQRDLGPGHLVAVRDIIGGEAIELLDSRGLILDWRRLTFREMAASEVSVCGQRRAVLAGIVAARLAAVA